MKEIMEAAAILEKLTVIGILGGLVFVLGMVIKQLWKSLQECNKKLLKMAQGKDIEE